MTTSDPSRAGNRSWNYRPDGWYPCPMFFDSAAWPPPPDGFDPPSPSPRLNPAQERTVMRTIAVLLLTLFVGPFAGSSLINGLVALFR